VVKIAETNTVTAIVAKYAGANREARFAKNSVFFAGAYITASR